MNHITNITKIINSSSHLVSAPKSIYRNTSRCCKTTFVNFSVRQNDNFLLRKCKSHVVKNVPVYTLHSSAPLNELQHSNRTSDTHSTQIEEKLPSCSSTDEESFDSSKTIDVDLINHLERTSLVDFDNKEALSRLQEAISFADTLFEVDTSGVEPMISVLEDESLFLREDKAEKTNRQDILTNALITEEDYFVAPPGNIPLEPQKKNYE